LKKRRKTRCAYFFKESNIEGSGGFATKMTIYICRVILYIPNKTNTAKPTPTNVFG